MPRPLVILGPTAGGKSSLAVALGQLVDGEVVSADSMQVYRHLDAGTAKPTPTQRAALPHHLVDTVEPTSRFTVHDWLLAAHAVNDEIAGRGRRPVFVGGTNLYLTALLHGLMQTPATDPTFRKSLADVPTDELHQRLAQLDPAAADRIDPQDRRRLTRALEVQHLTGRPLSEQQTQWDTRADAKERSDEASGIPPLSPPPILLGLRYPAEAINPRINLRVKAMFYPDKVDAELAADVCINGESLPDEVARLLSTGVLGPDSPQAREALGYKQLIALHEGSDPKIRSLDDAFERTKVLTRRFAKQQRTWLKRYARVHWLEAEGATSEALLKTALEAVREGEAE